MSASFYDLLKYAATGQASPDMTYYDRMRASTLMGGAIKTLTGVPPLSFTGNGKPLISWSMLGNGQQNGTPTPDNPVMPIFCGKLVESDWTIPITCAGQTSTVYLGQTQSTRRIKKLVFDGTEDWSINSNQAVFVLTGITQGYYDQRHGITCSHLIQYEFYYLFDRTVEYGIAFGARAADRICIRVADYENDIPAFKQWLSDQYSAGTPVTAWYVLAESETTIVNEPLCKIGDYADTLDSADAGITIPTARGSNTLTVDTEPQPSEMTITFKS